VLVHSGTTRFDSASSNRNSPRLCHAADDLGDDPDCDMVRSVCSQIAPKYDEREPPIRKHGPARCLHRRRHEHPRIRHSARQSFELMKLVPAEADGGPQGKIRGSTPCKANCHLILKPKQLDGVVASEDNVDEFIRQSVAERLAQPFSMSFQVGRGSTPSSDGPPSRSMQRKWKPRALPRQRRRAISPPSGNSRCRSTRSPANAICSAMGASF
jgi:hypothetical protein